MFSTHYHELMREYVKEPKVAIYHMSVLEQVQLPIPFKPDELDRINFRIQFRLNSINLTRVQFLKLIYATGIQILDYILEEPFLRTEN